MPNGNVKINKDDTIIDIPIKMIKDFPNHPFKVKDDEKMNDLVESVKENGVLYPLLVRPKEDGTYELISGHRRKRAAQKLNIDSIKCIVRNLSDDEATILMVDSNIQREEVLPSEKAFAYKMKLEAMKHQGKKIDLEIDEETSRPLVEKSVSADLLGNEVGESGRNIQRYIRLTHLIPELLEEVDNKRIAFRPAVDISYLPEDYQYVILNTLQYDEISPSVAQAVKLKKMAQEGTLTLEKVEELMAKEKPNQKEYTKISTDRLNKYIPESIKRRGDIEDFVIKCVEDYVKRQKNKEMSR
jgi:ParB family chromosome partitioning protein